MNFFHEVEGSNYDLRFHPVIPMWKGYEPQLCEYGLVVCEEWKSRGNPDNCYDQIAYHMDMAAGEEAVLTKPNWWGDVDFHVSHQAALVRYDPGYYLKIFKVERNLPLIWPVSDRAS